MEIAKGGWCEEIDWFFMPHRDMTKKELNIILIYWIGRIEILSRNIVCVGNIVGSRRSVGVGVVVVMSTETTKLRLWEEIDASHFVWLNHRNIDENIEGKISKFVQNIQKHICWDKWINSCMCVRVRNSHYVAFFPFSFHPFFKFIHPQNKISSFAKDVE